MNGHMLIFGMGYTASRLAIDPKTRAERGYLDMLAGRLKLPDALIDHVEATVVQA